MKPIRITRPATSNHHIKYPSGVESSSPAQNIVYFQSPSHHSAYLQQQRANIFLPRTISGISSPFMPSSTRRTPVFQQDGGYFETSLLMLSHRSQRHARDFASRPIANSAEMTSLPWKNSQSLLQAQATGDADVIHSSVSILTINIRRALPPPSTDHRSVLNEFRPHR